MPAPSDTHPYQGDFSSLEAKAALRHCRQTEPASQGLPHVLVNGKPALLFCSNDYLGLSQDGRLKQAAQEALQQYGTGTGASRLISGTTPLTQQLEQAVAQFKSAASALVFNSGYQANVGIVSALIREQDWAVGDKLNHASLVDGCLLSKGQWTRYAHLDMNHLESRLKQIQTKRKANSAVWIITDSVFSMDGDIADLGAIVGLAKQYDAFTLIDEAHATGLYGETRSSGQAEAQGVSQDITLQMGTFSKALGGAGAYVAGDELYIRWLVNHARSLIYSTAMTPATMATALAALHVVQTDPTPKQALWQNVKQAEQLLGQPCHSPIIPWVVGSSEETMAQSNAMLEAGYFIQGIRPPTVPEGSARLRLTLSALHQPQHLEGLFQALNSKTL